MRVLTFVSCLVGGLIGGGLVWVGQGMSLNLSPIGMAYSDLVAVMLTGIAVLLAAISVGLATLAFWGWTTFKGLTQKAAGGAALDHIKSKEGSAEIERIIELKAVLFIQENIRNGTLVALAEQRNRDEDDLKELDADWAGVIVEGRRDGE